MLRSVSVSSQAVGTRWFRKAGGHAAIDVWAIGEAALWSVSLVCGAEGDRAPSRSGLLHAGGRSPARASGIDNLQRAAAQRRHPKRRPRVSCDDSAMARRARCSPPKAGEACAQRGVKNLCRGTVGWRRCGSEQGSCSRPGRVLEKPSARTTGRTDDGQTPGARSRSPVACRWTSRTTRPCASAMKPSIKRCSFKVEARCAAN